MAKEAQRLEYTVVLKYVWNNVQIMETSCGKFYFLRSTTCWHVQMKESESLMEYYLMAGLYLWASLQSHFREFTAYRATAARMLHRKFWPFPVVPQRGERSPPGEVWGSALTAKLKTMQE